MIHIWQHAFWWRRLFAQLATAIIYGLLLTILSALTGFYMYGWRPHFGIYLNVPEQEDKSHWVGWTVDDSGQRRSLNPYPVNGVDTWQARQIISARRSDRPCQYLLYEHVQRGYPWGWYYYYNALNDEFGTYRNVPREDLCRYPKWKFDSIRWRALVANIGFWSALPFLLLGIPRLGRMVYRARCGRCLYCGYDVRGCVSLRCSECGYQVTHL